MSVPTHLPHQEPSPIAVSSINAIDYLIFKSSYYKPSQLLDSYFATLCSLLDHHSPLLTKNNKSCRTAPTPWITTEILSLKSARRRLERTYIASHSFFHLPSIASISLSLYIYIYIYTYIYIYSYFFGILYVTICFVNENNEIKIVYIKLAAFYYKVK